MDSLIKTIKKKLPPNCIYKIALIASVCAGKNNYCHHILLAEKIRPIIIESQYASTYAYNKPFKTRYNKYCKKIQNNIWRLDHLLSQDLKSYLDNLQYDDDAFFKNCDTVDSHLYYPVKQKKKHDRVGVYRGNHIEYNGYFKQNEEEYESSGNYNYSDIVGFKELLIKINNIKSLIEDSPIMDKKRSDRREKEFHTVIKKMIKLYNVGMNLLEDFDFELSEKLSILKI